MGCSWPTTKTTNKIDPENSSSNRSEDNLKETVKEEPTIDLLDVSSRQPVTNNIDRSEDESNKSKSLELITDVSRELTVAVLHDCMKTMKQTSENEHRLTTSDKQNVNHQNENVKESTATTFDEFMIVKKNIDSEEDITEK